MLCVKESLIHSQKSIASYELAKSAQADVYQYLFDTFKSSIWFDCEEKSQGYK